MKPIHKYNNGNGATLCNYCRTIIKESLTKDILCFDCKMKYLNELSGLICNWEGDCTEPHKEEKHWNDIVNLINGVTKP